MSKSQMGSVLDGCIRLVDMADLNPEIPAGEHKTERAYLNGAITAADADWAIYYIDVLISGIASAIGHLGIDVGSEFIGLLRTLISKNDGLASALTDGDSAAIESLQKQLEEWQSAHGVQPKPHRVDRSPLMAR